MIYHNRKPMRETVIKPENNDIIRNTKVNIVDIGVTDYMKSLKANIEKREQDKKDAEENNIAKDNYFISEVLWHIRVKGEVSEPRLARDLGLTNKVIHNVSNLLIEAKLITHKKNKRGSIIYKIGAFSPRRVAAS